MKNISFTAPNSNLIEVAAKNEEKNCCCHNDNKLALHVNFFQSYGYSFLFNVLAPVCLIRERKQKLITFYYFLSDQLKNCNYSTFKTYVH